MSYTDEFRAFARRHGVSDDATTRILWSVRPSTRIEIAFSSEGLGPEDRTIGHVGGLPELPADVTWHYGEYFVASLDLSALPKQPLDDAIPREGRLLLFADHEYSGYCDEIPATVIHVTPGTETTVRPAPADEGDVQELLQRRPLVLVPGTAWDIHDWPELEDPMELSAPAANAEEEKWRREDSLRRERHTELLAAVEEYGSKVADMPVIDRVASKLGGVELNPRRWKYGHDLAFWERREAAVPILRNEPERFDELHSQALDEVSEEKHRGWLNLVEFGQYALFDEGDGELSWVIHRDDLLARRFDNVRTSFNTT